MDESRLTFVLQLFGLLGREVEPVDVVLEDGGPVLQLVHDVPRRRHGHAKQHRRLREVGLCQGEPEEVAVRWVPIQDPMSKARVVWNQNQQCDIRYLILLSRWSALREIKNVGVCDNFVEAF